MVAADEPDTEELLDRAGRGDRSAVERLLARHRPRLRRMVAIRMDPRLAAQLDPSDVIQEALVQASPKLTNYLNDRPMPFYPWLRQLTWERLAHLHRRHVAASKRSVTREQDCDLYLPDQSAMELAGRLVASGTSPSARLVREEARSRVQAGLAQLATRDRELLVMRYLEQLSVGEIAAILGISEGAVRTRQFRAVERLHALLGDDLRQSD